MEIILSVIAFILIFSLLILIHEFGHYFVAKKSGIKVEEFGFGLPPRIWGKKKGETIYSINAIPFGGFVRMYGEDAHDKKVIKSKRSFAGKPLRNRIAVVVAGVFMNFLLGIFVLSIGFSLGMQPLLVNEQDIKSSIQDGIIEMNEGAVIKEVQEGSIAAEMGIEPDSIITTINNKEITDPSGITEIIKSDESNQGQNLILQIKSNESVETKDLGVSSLEEAGIVMHESIIYVSRPVINSIKTGSFSENVGLQKGDLILSVNGVQVYSLEDYYKELFTPQSEEFDGNVNLVISRDFERIEKTLNFKDEYQVAVSYVFPGSPAMEAGLQKGDVLFLVDTTLINTIDDVFEVNSNHKNNALNYLVVRDGEDVSLEITPDENGKIGAGLSLIIPHQISELDIYTGEAISTITEVKNVQYPVHIAIGESFKESWRLGVLTFGIFGDVIKSAVSDLSVPEGVSGPVGIARLTHMSVQEGFMTLWRFIALLSLSLAAINIFPLPALDGGRLLFLILEGIRGKRINPKWEAYIHTFGFLLLILLILFITFNDLVNWLIKGTF